MNRLLPAAAGVFACAVLAACSSSGTSVSSPTTTPVARAIAVAHKPAPRPKPAQVVPHAVVTYVHAPDGSLVTVAVLKGPVRYVLHDGSQDPYAPPGELRATSFIGAHERASLLAAFNGGFKMNAGDGGYKQEGHVLYPLLPGMASLVIARDGSARMLVWPDSGHVAGAYSVRQNLHPIVLHGAPTVAASEWGMWGATLGGGEFVARSSLGQDAHGDLIYAGSMSASPYALAWALARAGARIGMELDINPEWVQLDVARHPGGSLRTQVPGQNRPADQFILGWSRDFITVLG